MPPRNLTIIFVAAVVGFACYEKVQRNRPAARIAESMRIIEDKYYENVSPRHLYEGAMNGMVDVLDQYSAYIPPQHFGRFQESLDQEFGGVGIMVEINPDTKRLTVLTPLVGTPAHKQGILAGDQIMKIDGTDTKEMDMRDAVKLMRGKPGTSVQLTVLHRHATESVEMTVERAIIPIESVLGDTRKADGSWDFRLQENSRIAYIRVTTFGEHTVDELSQAMETDGKEADALIVDLRNNAGGLLSAAVSVCDMFLDHGEIVSTRGRGGKPGRSYSASSDLLVDPQMPVVVLVNRYSASASEIVAACLQDHGRVVVIGDRTWGKGTVQNVISMEGGRAALKLTTASYWRPSGKDIHRHKDDDENAQWGVSPDKGFEVKLTDEQFKKVVEQRRWKDIVQPNGEQSPHKDPTAKRTKNVSETNETNESSVPNEQDDGPFDDPQLRKAIEHLKQQLLKQDSRPERA